MAAKFHALTDKDVRNIGPFVTSNTDVDAYSILDTYYTGMEWSNSSIEQSLSSMHTRKVIKLEVPTFNHVLGRSGCTLLKKLLNVKTDDWQDIINVTKIYDIDAGELIPTDEAYEGGNYLYSAQIAEYLIGKLDIEKEKLNCLYSHLQGFIRDGVSVRSFITIDKNPNGVHLVDAYYAHYEQEDLVDSIKRGRNPDTVIEEFRASVFGTGDSRLSYLLNMNPDKSGLYGMLNYYIIVVPTEIRPKIDKQEHKLTKRYTAVIKANYEMKTCINSTTPKVIQSKYIMLENAVKRLQYKNKGNNSTVKPDDLAVLERIKTKKGQIRFRNLGKRQDYSGRAVVCINPYLPLDVIRVPQSMLPKLLEFHILPYLARNIVQNNEDIAEKQHISNIYDKLRLGNLDTPEARAEMLRIIKDEKLLDKVPMVLGRQPTLHKQSLQGFHIEMSDLQAIEVNPLVCPAFNMDFDGDQAHIEVPLGPKAIKEVNDLVMTTQNLFLPKTGECTTSPRQDMLYGLYLCTLDSYVLDKSKAVGTYETFAEVRQLVINHKVKVWDVVNILELGDAIIAGNAAFIACFPRGDVLPRGSNTPNGQLCVEQISSKNISKYVDHLLRIDSSGRFIHRIGSGRDSTETFVGSINALVETGFKVARLYPPNMSLLTPKVDLPNYDNAIDTFHKNMERIDLLYDLGLETSDNYKIKFNKCLDELNKARKGTEVVDAFGRKQFVGGVADKLGHDSGYYKLSVSGARGSMDNLLQAFSIKGQVKKNETESFDALLENSYASQLTPMEHFVAAYGGRQGQIDKSLKTGDTGYAMRQMWHATQGMTCTCLDCGTNRGITIKKADLAVFVEEDKPEDITAEISKIFAHALIGRYRVGSQKIITEQEANAWAKDSSVESITIRSPLTCNNPCCQKCYGIEWSTHKPAVVGVPVGIIAAQSIGEPGTQLTLKQFQKGGVAGKAEVTSAFDKVNNYIHVADLAKKSKNGTYTGYDPLAWATGKVIEKPASDISMKQIKIEGCKGQSIIVPKDVILKEYAVKGQGLSYKHGDYDIRELLKYSGITAAQLYLAFKLYALYQSEVKIKMVHFEVLVASMTRYMILSTTRSDLMVGQFATAQELFRGDISKTEYIPKLIGVKELTNASHDALDSIIMESPVEGLSRICLLGMEDSLTKPINRMVLGQTIIDGSAKPGFIESRKEII